MRLVREINFIFTQSMRVMAKCPSTYCVGAFVEKQQYFYSTECNNLENKKIALSLDPLYLEENN